MAIITKANGCFPIASSVTMSREVLEGCIENSIDVVEIERAFSQRSDVRSIYSNEVNVVGKDIEQPALETVKIHNDGSDSFKKAILEYVKQK